MPRCWRLNYANEFHLDITPSITNPECSAGGELVPDKKLNRWKASNPKGYRAHFERRASLQPRMRIQESAVFKGKREDIEAFPVRMGVKGVLRRTVQLAKRCRDMYFQTLDPSLAPISIIITTLAARSYEYCVLNFEYDSEFDLLKHVIRLMPEFIEERTILGQPQWFVWNETTEGENFAEKWNTDPGRADAYFDWHARAVNDFEAFPQLEGLDQLTKRLSESFGKAQVTKAMSTLTDEITGARTTGHLSVAPGVGLSVGTAAAFASISTKRRWLPPR